MYDSDRSNRSPRFALVLAAALILAALALFYVYLQRRRAPNSAAELASSAKIATVVATKDVKPGAVLRPEMVALKELPSAQVPPGALMTPAQAYGRVTTRALSPDMPLTQEMVVSASAALGPAYALSRNLRAVTFSADIVQGVAGYVKPGDHVDVIATFDKTTQASSKVILQDIEVLAVGGAPPATGTGSAQDRAQTVPVANEGPITLAMTVPEAEELMLADIRGKIRLALRPANGADFVLSKGVTEASLTGIRPSGGGSGGSGSSGSENTARVIVSTPDLRAMATQMRRSPSALTGSGVVGAGSPSRGAAFGAPPSWRPISLPPSGRTFPTAPPPAPREHTITVIRGSQSETVTVPMASNTAR